jgi:hypothetical protein
MHKCYEPSMKRYVALLFVRKIFLWQEYLPLCIFGERSDPTNDGVTFNGMSNEVSISVVYFYQRKNQNIFFERPVVWYSIHKRTKNASRIFTSHHIEIRTNLRSIWSIAKSILFLFYSSLASTLDSFSLRTFIFMNYAKPLLSRLNITKKRIFVNLCAHFSS